MGVTATCASVNMTCLADFYCLATVGSRWHYTSARQNSATCTVTRTAAGRPTQIRGIRQDGTSFAHGRLDLPSARDLTITGDSVQVRLDLGRGPETLSSWHYLGQTTEPVEQPPIDPADALACRTDRLLPGDIVYGPARRHTDSTPGYTVEVVDLTTSPARITTREGWPLHHAPWQLLAITPISGPERCQQVPRLPDLGHPQVFLGINTLAWLGYPELAHIPKCVSRNRLRSHRTRRLPRSTSSLLIDSGGFTELQRHGRWRTSAAEYVTEIRTVIDQLGGIERIHGIAQQDWMCESVIIEGGRTKDGTFFGTRNHLDPGRHRSLADLIVEHQRRTVENFIELRRLAPDLPIFPVLQGQAIGDYLRHLGMFIDAGVAFVDEPLIGLGSVCRRQGARESADLVRALAGLRLHGFGVGLAGLRRYGKKIISADSMAWSFHGRRAIGRCPHRRVKWEQNCPILARTWWEAAQAHAEGRDAPSIPRPPAYLVPPAPVQLELFSYELAA